jgi:hypothetical protein
VDGEGEMSADKVVFLACAIAFGVSIVTPPASQPVPIMKVKERPPLTQWSCNAQERKEYLYACKHRTKAL